MKWVKNFGNGKKFEQIGFSFLCTSKIGVKSSPVCHWNDKMLEAFWANENVFDMHETDLDNQKLDVGKEKYVSRYRSIRPIFKYSLHMFVYRLKSWPEENENKISKDWNIFSLLFMCVNSIRCTQILLMCDAPVCSFWFLCLSLKHSISLGFVCAHHDVNCWIKLYNFLVRLFVVYSKNGHKSLHHIKMCLHITNDFGF